MAEDIASASVEINVNRVSGNIESKGENSSSIKILKDILTQMKAGNDIASKAAKLTQAGLLGKGAELIAAGGIASIAALAAALTTIKGDTNPAIEDRTAYQKALVDGEEKVLAIDDATGKVIDVLTMQEAEQRGILDNLGNVKAGYGVASQIVSDLLEPMTKSRDMVVLSQAELESILSEEQKEKEIQKQINEAKRKKLRSLGGSSDSATNESQYGTGGATAPIHGDPVQTITSILTQINQNNQNKLAERTYSSMKPNFLNYIGINK